MKRNLLIFLPLFILLGLFLPGTGISSTEVIITGKGTSKEEAITDALRNAVEKAAGVFVYSVTEIKNFGVVSDKIVSASKGYVKDYRIVGETTQDRVVFLTAAVIVDSEAIKKRFRDDSKAIMYDDVLKDYLAVKNQQTSLNKLADMLKTLSTRPLNEMYAADYTGYEVSNVGINSATVGIKYKVRLNPFFWDTYYTVLGLADGTGSAFSACIDYKLTAIMEDYYYRGAAYRIHPDIVRNVVKPRTAAVIIDFAGVQHRVPGFRLYEKMFSMLYKLDHFQAVNEQTATCQVGPVSGKTANDISIIPDEGKEFITQLKVDDVDVLKSLARVKITLIEE